MSWFIIWFFRSWAGDKPQSLLDFLALTQTTQVQIPNHKTWARGQFPHNLAPLRASTMRLKPLDNPQLSLPGKTHPSSPIITAAALIPQDPLSRWLCNWLMHSWHTPRKAAWIWQNKWSFYFNFLLDAGRDFHKTTFTTKRRYKIMRGYKLIKMEMEAIFKKTW